MDLAVGLEADDGLERPDDLLLRRSERQHIPNTHVDFSELSRQRAIKGQQRLAAVWSKTSRDIVAEIEYVQTDLDAVPSPTGAEKILKRIETMWRSFESIHFQYVLGIKEQKRRQEVEERYVDLKGKVSNIAEHCHRCMQLGQLRQEDDDNASMCSKMSICSHKSTSSRGSSISSQKEKLRTALLAKKKLELARARAKEEAEEARRKAEEHTRRELRDLEDAVALAELDWQIEAAYDEETSVVRDINDFKPLIEPEAKQDQRSQRHDTCLDPCASAFNPKRVPCFSSTPKTTSEARPAEQTKLLPCRLDDEVAETADDQERCQAGQPTKSAALSTNSRPLREPVPSGEDVSDSDDEENEDVPKDHVAAMLKIQLLNGMKPAQFAGNPSEFPFFRKQVRTHLEGNMLTDAQRVEYLPKFLSGEALEVIKRNRGCSYKALIRTLEERFGNPIQVAQHCIEELVSGPKVVYGDNAGLLNFAERLNTATKVLKGEYEREISVATNLKRIVNRLPADMIGKWQNENYKIVNGGSTARLKDVASFVKKQAKIKNDPVYGTPKRDNREVKHAPKSSKGQSTTSKQTTIASTSVNSSSTEKDSNPAICVICKGPSHKLDQCPVIEHCDQVAIRRSYAASYGYCFNCGRHQPGHGSSTCPEPPACTRCPGPHLKLLHQDSRPDKSRIRLPYQRDKSGASSDEAIVKPRSLPWQNRTDKPIKSDGKQRTVVTSAGASTAKTKVLLNVVPVTITAENGRSVSTYAFLDNGCTDTLVDQELADHLGLKGVPQEIQINTITNSDVPRMSQRVRFTLTPANGEGEEIEVEDAYILPDLNQSEQALPRAVDVSQYPHLQDLYFPDVDLKRVAILIGSNIPNAHVQKEVRMPEDKKNCLYGYRYPLGWSLAGPLDVTGHRITSLNAISVDRQLNDQVERFWTVEDYGAVKANEKPLSVEDKRALRIIQDTTQIDDGHYEVGLLWKEDNTQLPNNLSLAERRLASLKRRLTKPGNEELAVRYRGTMNDYIAKGYARRLDPDEVAKESQICWYLPHHPVVNPNKPGKVRIVYDAAAEFKGQSLNKNLVQGPDMTNSLIGVLLRFRQDNVGIATDVEAMFHQIGVRKQDQDALRFLWWTDNYDDPPDVYVMQVHIFGAASSPCVANSILRRTADDNATDFDEDVVTAVKRNFYVDDGLPSAKDPTSAARLASDMAELLSRGGFNLTKFMSNSKEVLAAIPVEKRAAPELNLDLDELPTERALGVRWFVQTDELGFVVKELNRPDTKRGLLSTVCSLYDPLGLAAPVTLSARSLIQELWKAKVDWDEPLEDRYLEKWSKWKAELASLSTFRIPRSFFLPETHVPLCKLQLHHFADASEVGYGTSSYLRVEYPDNTIHCSFVMGKSRNAPVKFTSIPRLELQGAVLATRMNKMLRQELDLDIHRTLYWTDSQIVLHYLKNEKRRFQTYVANRVEEIKENSLIEQWNHVPGTLNPADDVSRGINPSELSPGHRWLRGPEFLWQPESCWPNADLVVVPDERLELKKGQAYCTDLKVSPNDCKERARPEPIKNESSSNYTVQQMINNCSDWTCLRRRIAWLIRFTQFIRDRKTVRTDGLTPDDYQAATAAIARVVQNLAFKSEITDLKAAKPIKTTSKISNLNPMLDDQGVLRVDGRIKNAPVAYVARNQIILPRNHHVASIIVRHIHVLMGHLGREHVIAKLRELFWIPQARVLIRSVLGRCLTCKRINSRPMTQQMAPLPRDRTIAYEPPFSYTGMDLFGPLHVKYGRGTAKRWCCLFTCLNTRSIHLEVVNSMDTDDFIMCLRRFVNRRGEICELRCDNGTNFVGGKRELSEAIALWNQSQIERELTQRGCKWVFQPPTASSMSGVWERLVRSAKTVLKSLIGSHTVTDVVLQTLLTEVERMLNGRALTANSSDPNDLEPLTPAHFLMQRRVICLPPGVFNEADSFHRKKWRQIQYLADLFWTRWLKEYLPTLQTRSKWHRTKYSIKPNDLVLLVDHAAPRGHWKLGRVMVVYPGPDGLVRTAKVKTSESTYVRPIQKLCLLECDLDKPCLAVK